MKITGSKCLHLSPSWILTPPSFLLNLCTVNGLWSEFALILSCNSVLNIVINVEHPLKLVMVCPYEYDDNSILV